MNSKCDRKISVYGYLRGTNLKKNSMIHIGSNKLGDPEVTANMYVL